MTFAANVVRVMIASPSDTTDARDAVERALYGWNDAHAYTRRVILQPWRWESSSVPELGGHPQSLINAQGVDESDIVIALFGSKLGSPTPGAASGTVEEIERAAHQKKPVHVYFSTAALPVDVDTEQLTGLREFKRQLQDRGLYGEFHNASELEHEVWKAIQFDLDKMILAPPATLQPGGVRWSVQPQREERLKEMDAKGKAKYESKHWIEVTNNGGVDAEQVLYESVGESPSMHVFAESATTIHAQQTRRVPVMFSWGGGSEPVLRIHWVEDGEGRFKDFHVG